MLCCDELYFVAVSNALSDDPAAGEGWKPASRRPLFPLFRHLSPTCEPVAQRPTAIPTSVHLTTDECERLFQTNAARLSEAAKTTAESSRRGALRQAQYLREAEGRGGGRCLRDGGAGFGRAPGSGSSSQAPGGAEMAGASSTLGFFATAEQAAAEARRLPIRRRRSGRHHRFLDDRNAHCKPFQWVADHSNIIAAVRRARQALDHSG